MKTYRGTVVGRSAAVSVSSDAGVRPLAARYDLRNHSPDGFSWGYHGSGPSQLALALLADALEDDERAEQLYQTFKALVVAGWDQDRGWSTTQEEIRDWADIHDQLNNLTRGQ